MGGRRNHCAERRKPDTGSVDSRSHLVGFCLCEISCIGRSIETESRLEVARGWHEETWKCGTSLLLRLKERFQNCIEVEGLLVFCMN